MSVAVNATAPLAPLNVVTAEVKNPAELTPASYGVYPSCVAMSVAVNAITPAAPLKLTTPVAAAVFMKVPSGNLRPPDLTSMPPPVTITVAVLSGRKLMYPTSLVQMSITPTLGSPELFNSAILVFGHKLI